MTQSVDDPTSSSPSSPAPTLLKPSAHQLKRAHALLRQNRQVSERLFPPLSQTFDAADITFDDRPYDSVILEAARLRKRVQLSHSPYAPRKRTRHPQSSSSAHEPVSELSSAERTSPQLETTSKQLIQVHPTTERESQPQHQQSTNTSVIPRYRAIEEEDKQSLATPHAKWKLYRIISGHLGWVRCIQFDHSNRWFATGANDRTIKIWDSASGRLKLTLTGHISAPRCLSISPKYPYLFSVSEDKTVKCWDLEQNKVIRNYHGHLSGVYTCALHPTLDVLVTGGRDSTIRVWDIRTRQQIHVLGGHRDTVNSIFAQGVDPQIVSASIDSTVRMWDLRNLKCSAVLTNHKKSVRAIAKHPREFSFVSASFDSIKSWALPDGVFMRDFKNLTSPKNTKDYTEKAHGGKLVNDVTVNEDDVVVSGGDDGILRFWDYKSATMFDEMQSTVQPGSLDCEAGVQCVSFDKSGSRLVTGETDKTVRMYREE